MYGYDQNPGAQQQYAQQPPQGYAQQAPPLYPEPSPPSLTDAVRAFTTGSLSAEDFQQIFATSKVYCPRGDTPDSWRCTTRSTRSSPCSPRSRNCAGTPARSPSTS